MGIPFEPASILLSSTTWNPSPNSPTTLPFSSSMRTICPPAWELALPGTYASPGWNLEGSYGGMAISFALLVLLDLGRAALGGGARSRNAVHCARIVSNVSTSS